MRIWRFLILDGINISKDHRVLCRCRKFHSSLQKLCLAVARIIRKIPRGVQKDDASLLRLGQREQLRSRDESGVRFQELFTDRHLCSFVGKYVGVKKKVNCEIKKIKRAPQ